MLEDKGFLVSIRPLIEITGLDDPGQQQKQQVIDLDHYDHIIFVSKSAVRFGMPLLEAYWPQWPVALKWYAVGQGTASELADHDVRAAFPERPGSEGLLQLASLLEVKDDRVLIVRGVGGRDLLADTLAGRGARVDYLEIYQRQALRYPDWDQWPQAGHEGVLVITSLGVLESFLEQFEGDPTSLSVVTVSQRISDVARTAGFHQVLNAGGASDQALYDAISDVLNEKSG